MRETANGRGAPRTDARQQAVINELTDLVTEFLRLSDEMTTRGEFTSAQVYAARASDARMNRDQLILEMQDHNRGVTYAHGCWNPPVRSGRLRELFS